VHANDVAAISRYGPQAAAQARTRDAAREAVAHWDMTLQRGHPADAAEEERWLEAAFLAFTRAGRNEGREALCMRLEALARERGDLSWAAANIARRSMCWVARNNHARALAISAEAMAIVEPLPASERKVMVWRNEAWLRMLERDCVESLEWARRALAMADALGLVEQRHTFLHLIACDRLLLEGEPGIRAMQDVIDGLKREGRRAEAVGCLLNLGSGAGEIMRFDAAEPALREAVAISQALEMDGSADYVQAWLALCRLHQGDWSEAGALALAVGQRPGAAEMSRLMALVALGRLRVRRGDPGAQDALGEALHLVGDTGTLQRLAPVRAARAEAAFARGDRAGVAAEVDAALPLAQAKRHPWFIGELAYWGWRAGSIGAPPPDCAEPYALEMTGRWREAAGAWRALDCPYEQARALAAGDAEAQQQALAIFDRLGAAPAAEALRRRLREAGVRGVARGARGSTRAHPCGLTTAEMKVLRLMGEGLRNAEIAARVHRSVRTVDHHVAAVLAKLGVESRGEAVRRAEREGWLAPDGQSGQSGDAN
jgi:DNA-binding CsgD family transcriptional regulator